MPLVHALQRACMPHHLLSVLPPLSTPFARWLALGQQAMPQNWNNRGYDCEGPPPLTAAKRVG
jgi:hypothetical protein